MSRTRFNCKPLVLGLAAFMAALSSHAENAVSPAGLWHAFHEQSPPTDRIGFSLPGRTQIWPREE